MANPATCTDYYFNNVTKLLLNVGHTYTFPTSLWLALFTGTPPGLSGSPAPTEVSGNNYGRVEIAQGGWTGPAGVNCEYSNTLALTFEVPGGNWGTITCGGLYNAQTNGNLLFVCNITTSRAVNSGDGAPRVLAGALKISRATC